MPPHTLILAQAPPPLPPTPLGERLLFENPWPLAGALAAAGIVAAVTLRRRRVRAATGALGIAAAIGIWSLARARETEPERLRAATAALVAGAAAADETALEPLLAEDCQVWFADRVQADGRRAILDRVRQTTGGQWAVKEHDILETRAHADGPRVARTQVRVRVIPEATRFPDTSWWALDWRKDVGGRWVADRIELIGREDIAAELR